MYSASHEYVSNIPISLRHVAFGAYDPMFDLE